MLREMRRMFAKAQIILERPLRVVIYKSEAQWRGQDLIIAQSLDFGPLANDPDKSVAIADLLDFLYGFLLCRHIVVPTHTRDPKDLELYRQFLCMGVPEELLVVWEVAKPISDANFPEDLFEVREYLGTTDQATAEKFLRQTCPDKKID